MPRETKMCPLSALTGVEFQNPLSEDADEIKRKYKLSCLIFSLPAVSCNFIFFFCTDPCASRDSS